MNNEQIRVLSDLAVKNIDQIFKYFDIPYYGQQKLYISCPIHDGDNPHALNIYLNGHTINFYWRCRTHHCEEKFKPTLIGLVRGLLSVKYKVDNYPFHKTIEFLTNFLGVNLSGSDFQLSEEEIDKRKFTRIKEEKSLVGGKLCINKAQVRNLLTRPVDFYLDKGIAPEIIDRYDIGICNKKNREMTDRIVCPIYDESGNNMIGCTGRSVYDKCDQCSFHHSPVFVCPTQQKDYVKYCKWRHHGFNSGEVLFNYYNAKPYIKKTNTAIIVESVGNVLKLETAGIKNSVCIFGTILTDGHLFLLDNIGVMNLKILFDNDEAGKNAAVSLEKRLGKLFNVELIKIPDCYNDVCDMTTEEIWKINQ